MIKKKLKQQPFSPQHFSPELLIAIHAEIIEYKLDKSHMAKGESGKQHI